MLVSTVSVIDNFGIIYPVNNLIIKYALYGKLVFYIFINIFPRTYEFVAYNISKMTISTQGED